MTGLSIVPIPGIPTSHPLAVTPAYAATLVVTNTNDSGTGSLREAFAFHQLRAAPNAHFSIRKVAERMAEEIQRVHPLLAKYMPMPQETWQDVDEQYFVK
jgi:hypothetical protein